MPSRQRVPGRVLPTSPFRREERIPPSTAEFSVGDLVTLDSWGMGRVVEVYEDYVLVNFRNVGDKRIPAGSRGFSRL